MCSFAGGQIPNTADIYLQKSQRWSTFSVHRQEDLLLPVSDRNPGGELQKQPQHYDSSDNLQTHVSSRISGARSNQSGPRKSWETPLKLDGTLARTMLLFCLPNWL